MNEIYNLSNDTMEIITHSKDFPIDGRFRLTTDESDLFYTLGINDYYIGEYAGSAKAPAAKSKDCIEPTSTALAVGKKYGDRSFRVGAMSIHSLSEFEKAQKYKYSFNEYRDFMISEGFIRNYDWETLIARFQEYDPKAGAGTNAEKLAALIKNETGVKIPKGILASEFIYNDLIQKPKDWKKTLEKSKDALNFDEKIKLVAKFGKDFSDDYNTDRLGNGSQSDGFISTENLLTNISTDEKGGVCRDISLAQAQMLKSLGVNQAYSINYLANSGGHSTLLAVDPKDKNRIIKINYYEVQTDDGKKGKAVLDQDSTLPNVGTQYRIFDSEGKWITNVPTELGNILREVTGHDKDIGEAGRNYSLNKAFFETEKLNGSLFNGQTSTGEIINGVAIHNNTKFNKNLDLKFGAAGYNVNADKTYFSMNETGINAYYGADYKVKIYDGEHGKLGTSVGGTMEVLVVKTSSEYKKTGKESSKTVTDKSYTLNSRTTYENKITDKDKIAISGQVNASYEKGNVADEGSRNFRYESTVLISSYEHEFNKDLKASLDVSNKLASYGNSSTFQATLKENANKYTLGGTIVSSDAPSFLVGQNTVNAGYERETKKGWNFKMEYLKNLESSDDQVKLKASKKW